MLFTDDAVSLDGFSQTAYVILRSTVSIFTLCFFKLVPLYNLTSFFVVCISFLCSCMFSFAFFTAWPSSYIVFCCYRSLSLHVSVYTVNASLTLCSNGKITNPWNVTSNSFFLPIAPTQCWSLCCIIVLVLSGQWLSSLVGLWCNVQNTLVSVVCSMGIEWACRVSVLTFLILSYSQRGFC